MQNEVEMTISEDNPTININKGMHVITEFKTKLPPKQQLTGGDYISNDYKDSPSPVKVMVRVFDGNLS